MELRSIVVSTICKTLKKDKAHGRKPQKNIAAKPGYSGLVKAFRGQLCHLRDWKV